jgi:hypothetical protein
MKNPLDPSRARLVAELCKQLALTTDVDVALIVVLKRDGDHVDAGLSSFGRSADDTALAPTRIPIDRALLVGSLALLHAIGGGTSTVLGDEYRYPDLEL